MGLPVAGACLIAEMAAPVSPAAEPARDSDLSVTSAPSVHRSKTCSGQGGLVRRLIRRILTAWPSLTPLGDLER